jgi:hypothetical protein
MRRALITTAAAIIVTALAVSTAGCGGSAAAGAPPTVHPPASHRPAAVTQAGARQAEIYEQVLRRYLSTPEENSFPQAFKTVYVLNQAYADAADPNGKHGRGAPIAPQTQRQVTAALAGMAHVIFIADRGSVMEANSAGCWHVRNGGILITLGVPAGHGNQVHVGINGFVACLGATWLTYVLHDQPGAGWRVTGTTGSMAIS